MAEELLDSVTCIELLDPIRQVCAIVRTRDEVPRGIIEPIGSVGRMPSGKDRGSVLDGDTDGLGAEVGSYTQLVGDGRRQEVAWRHLPALAVGHPYGGYEGILCAVDGLTVLEEVVACYAVDSGHAPRMYGAMADGGVGRDVVDARILAVEALRE